MLRRVMVVVGVVFFRRGCGIRWSTTRSKGYDGEVKAAATASSRSKCANQRLYDTERSCYITLEDLGAMVRGRRSFRLSPQERRGHPLCCPQIIMDTETRGETLLPVNFCAT